MSDKAKSTEAASERHGESARPVLRVAGILAWLVGYPRGRWATATGRWVRTVVTAGLLVTALGAWVLAIVQPWKYRPEAAAMVSLPSWHIGPQKAYAATDRLERLCARFAAPEPRRLRCDPFNRTGAVVEPPGASGSGAPGAVPGTPANRMAKTDDAAPREMLKAIRGMRLEMTLVSPDGKSWAVIDGCEYSEGDLVGEMKVVEIQEGRVKLRKAGITCLLCMD
jgi:hypothetical protein